MNGLVHGGVYEAADEDDVIEVDISVGDAFPVGRHAIQYDAAGLMMPVKSSPHL